MEGVKGEFSVKAPDKLTVALHGSNVSYHSKANEMFSPNCVRLDDSRECNYSTQDF